ncbi:MAG: hypothetical protein U0797_01210 [Gemmataceae bacterium]
MLLPCETSHERAPARLLDGPADGESVLLVTAALGKTLLAHLLLDRLGDGVEIVLANPHPPPRPGRPVAGDARCSTSLPHEGRGEQEMTGAAGTT